MLTDLQLLSRSFSWLIAGLTALLTAGGVVVAESPRPSPTNVGRDVIVNSSDRSAQFATPKQNAPAIAVPVVATAAGPSFTASAPLASATASTRVNPVPLHELVHSFPKPPMHPCGHLARDADGWLWGTVTSGGNYGLGAIYKMRADGTDWQEVLAFNGIKGLPRGSSPRGGLTPAPDGTFWGVTENGGEHNGGTLYHFDPRSGALTTAVEFDWVGSPWARPWIAPDGRIWGTTHYSIYCFNPKSRETTMIARFTGRTGRLRGGRTQAGLVPDGLGFLWGATADGGSSGNGTLFKVDLATGEAATFLDFTGKTGAFIGKLPLGDLTLGPDGNLWGTTCIGGSDDFGTVFKIEPSTGGFSHVAEFNARNRIGRAPETQLVADGEGFYWGTTSYGGMNGHGSIYKVNAGTGELTSMVAFTGMDGGAQGGPARGDILPDGAGGFFGACDFGGKSRLGVVYHLDIKTGAYTVLKDIAETAPNAEGSDPRGMLVGDGAGWLWGGTKDGGAQHSGTIYKFNPLTDELVTVVHFTGAGGPCRGLFSCLPLVRDGKGFLWGATYIGQTLGEGTIFKISERTGEFTEVIEISSKNTPGVQAPFGGITFDNKGFLWAAAYTSIIKIDPNARTVKTIAPVNGGWLRGGLALDGKGVLWGCSQVRRGGRSASLFKIDTANDKLTVVQAFDNADAGWNGWNPDTGMWWDGRESMWFSAVFDVGTGKRQCTLYELNTRTGELIGSHRSRDFSMINSPMLGGHGLLWGTGTQYGFGSPGYIYTFDARSRQFAKLFEFTGAGSQALMGAQPDVARLHRHTDGNFYGMTRLGGPGNGGTIYRLRFGPTPKTQEAVILSDGRVELHGTLRPNGRDTTAAFEWGLDPLLEDARTLEGGIVRAGEVVKSVQSLLSGLKRGTTHYFRLRGSNPNNAVPQRGAILQFTIPAKAPAEAVLAAGPRSGGGSSVRADTTKQGQVDASARATKHRLRIIMVPGAGAGIVRGVMRGEAYEIGKSYTLTAHADNGYVFAQWAGAGIMGSAAEDPQLNFTFTPELAKRPFITATFLHNPFQKDILGSYHGLVHPLEGVQPGIDTTGAVEMQLEEFGEFKGLLCYDGDELPFEGTFDVGGSARFGDDLAFVGAIARAGKPSLLLSLQLDLSADGPGCILGQMGLWDGKEATWQSQAHAALSVPAGTLATDPVIRRLAESGRIDLEMLALDTGEISPAQVLLRPDGHLQLSATLSDGTMVLSVGHLSKQSQISFFQWLHPEGGDSFGVEVPLASLLQRPQVAAAPGWWIPRGRVMRPITLQATPTEVTGK